MTFNRVMGVTAGDLAGHVLGGRFRLIRSFGAGGFGQVYLAEQLSMKREVAVKIIHPRLARDQTVVQRFEREARFASQLTHPNTVVYFDFGQEGDLLFLAMEYIQGRRLDHLLAKEGPLEIPRMAHMTQQICGSLEEAHALGMVHRDLKPSNILITERGGDPDFVKVIDFGLAKIVAGEIDAGGILATEKGAMLGTPAYMSPEQIRGEPVDHRCDIYSLGVLMFVMLTRQRPFAAGSPQETIQKHLNQQIPSARARNRKVPESLDRLVRWCLAKNREDRPSSVADIGRDLIAYLDRPVRIRPATGGGGPQVPQEVSTVPGARGPGNQVAYAPTQSFPPTARQEGDSAATDASSAIPSGNQPTRPESGRPGGVLGRLQSVGSVEVPSAGSVSVTRRSWWGIRLVLVLSAAAAGVLLMATGVVLVLLFAGHHGTVSTTPASEPGDGGSVPSAEQQSVPGDSLHGGLASAAAQAGSSPVDPERFWGDRAAPTGAMQADHGTGLPEVPPGNAAVVSGSASGRTLQSDGTEEEVSSNQGSDVVSSRPEGHPVNSAPSDRRSGIDRGSVRITAVPWGDVFCNNERLGRTPVDRRLAPGHYECVVRGPHGQTSPARFDLEAGETEVIRINFNQ